MKSDNPYYSVVRYKHGGVLVHNIYGGFWIRFKVLTFGGAENNVFQTDMEYVSQCVQETIEYANNKNFGHFISIK